MVYERNVDYMELSKVSSELCRFPLIPSVVFFIYELKYNVHVTCIFKRRDAEIVEDETDHDMESLQVCITP